MALDRQQASLEIFLLVLLLMFGKCASQSSDGTTTTTTSSSTVGSSTEITVPGGAAAVDGGADNRTLAMSMASEWGAVGNYSFLVISEAGVGSAALVLNVTSKYLQQKRGDKVDMAIVQLNSNENDVKKAMCDQLRSLNGRNSANGPLMVNGIIDTTRSQDLTKKLATALAPLGLPTFAMGCCSSKYERGYVSGAMPSSSSSSSADAAERVDDQSTRVTFSSLAHLMTQAARYIIENDTIGTAALYFDNRFDLERGHTLLLTNVATRHTIKELAYSSPARAAEQIKRAVNDNLFNIFLLTNMRTAEAYVLQAEQFEMAKPKYSWYVITTDLADFKCSNCKEARVNVFRPLPVDLDEAEAILEFFKSQDTVLTIGIGSSTEQPPSAYDNVYLASANTTTPASKAAEFNQRPKLNATASAKVLFLYDALSASIKMLKQIDSLPNVDIAEAMCGTGAAATDAPSFNLSTIAQQTMHAGVLGLVGTQSEDDGLVYVQAQVSVKQYDFRSINASEPAKSDDPAKVTEYGMWTLQDGLVRREGAPAWQLSRKTYRITVMNIEPFVFRRPNETEWVGYCIDLIGAISEDLGFGYEIYEVFDKTYGTLNDTTGEWDGLVRELQQKNADIALAPLSVMAERENVIDFTVPYFDLVGITILMKKTKEKPSLFKFIDVLEVNVWLAIIGAYVVTSILLFVFDRFSPYSYRNVLKRRERELQRGDEIQQQTTNTTTQQQQQQQNGGVKTITQTTTTTVAADDMAALAPEEDFYGSRVFTLKESFWFCMTSLTPQGGGEAPRNLSGRLVAATWWMFGFIIIASYTANLAAFLTVSRLESSIESLDDLSKQYGIKYAPQVGTATETYFRRMALIEDKFYQIWRDMSLNESMDERERAKLAVWDYPVSDKYTKLWLTMQENQRPTTFEEGIKWVKESKDDENGFAFIGDAALLQYRANTDPECELQLVGEEFSRKPYALAVQEDSHLKEELSGAILKLLNARKLEQIKEKWWQQHSNKCTRRDESSEGISIENIGGVFIVVLVGTVIACVMLAVEFYWYRLRKTAKVDELRTSAVAKVLGHAFGGREEAIAVKQREHNGGLPDVAMY